MNWRHFVLSFKGIQSNFKMSGRSDGRMLIWKQWAFVLFVLGYMSYNYGARYVQSWVKLFRVFISDENARFPAAFSIVFWLVIVINVRVKLYWIAMFMYSFFFRYTTVKASFSFWIHQQRVYEEQQRQQRNDIMSCVFIATKIFRSKKKRDN